MVTPDTAVLIVQATPWSPSTPGAVTGDVVFVNIQNEKDLDQYKGKLEGKIVLFGAMREVPPVDKALFDRDTREKELDDIAEFTVSANAGGLPPETAARMRERMERLRMLDRIAQFFADEKVAGVIEPSRDGENGGGSGGTFFDDNGATLGRTPYIADKRVKIPVVVAAIESYGRFTGSRRPMCRRAWRSMWTRSSPVITSTASTRSPRFPAPTPNSRTRSSWWAGISIAGSPAPAQRTTAPARSSPWRRCGF